MSSRVTSFANAPLRLDIRLGVGARHIAADGCTVSYLSIFDDEIEARLDEFLGFEVPTIWTSRALANAALRLEPTDAVVVGCRNGQVLVARGGAANFPLYWTVRAGTLLVSTVLPVDRDRVLSTTGLITSLAVVSLGGQNEPNLSARTPLLDWFRCRRGAVSRLSARFGCDSEAPIDLANAEGTEHGRESLVEALRSALDKFGRRQQSQPKALVELSGGFDSTLAANAARSNGVELTGVSVHFPYYEFRFEDALQAAVAHSLGISRVRIDGTTDFSFAPSEWSPKLDEPAVSVIGLKHAVAVASLASSEGMRRILVGHGGDQLFCEQLLEPHATFHPLERSAFSLEAWRVAELARALMESSPAFMKRSSLTFLYDARLDVALKENFGTTTRSPFTDLEMVKCGLAWSRLSARLGLPPNKGILTEAFATELPSAVTGRRGKVPWDGVSMRAYATHADSIATEIERVSGPIERVGMDARWLVGRVQQLARGQKSTTARDDREVIAGYALATWLRSWGVERVSDCGWTG